MLRRPENHVVIGVLMMDDLGMIPHDQSRAFSSSRCDLDLIAATRTIAKAEAMAKGHARVSCKTIDVNSEESIDSLVKDCDIVIRYVEMIGQGREYCGSSPQAGT
jgi:hypothetical protein